MSAPAAANGAAALMGVISGGILGGALHAIAGEINMPSQEVPPGTPFSLFFSFNLF